MMEGGLGDGEIHLVLVRMGGVTVASGGEITRSDDKTTGIQDQHQVDEFDGGHRRLGYSSALFKGC